MPCLFVGDPVIARMAVDAPELEPLFDPDSDAVDGLIRTVEEEVPV